MCYIERHFISAFYLLEQDLKDIFLYVDPVAKNYATFSHRLYALYMRSCMEFEAICKQILKEEGIKTEKKPTIQDYYKIHRKYTLINDCEVKLEISEKIVLKPLEFWLADKGPEWYGSHQAVKHDRVTEFEKANLKNTLDAISAVFILLYVRYGINILNRYHECQFYHDDDDGFIFGDSMFRIKKITTNND